MIDTLNDGKNDDIDNDIGHRNERTFSRTVELTPLTTTTTTNDASARDDQSVIVPIAPETKKDILPTGNNAAASIAAIKPPLHVLLARRLLYVSHVFAQFSEISWQFCLSIFLAACTNYQSMILVSSYGLFVSLAVCCAGASVGRYIDVSNRLETARRFIGCENLCVVVATLFCYVLLSDQKTANKHKIDDSIENMDPEQETWFQSRLKNVPTDPTSLVALFMIHVLGASAQVVDQGFLVAIERDWVVVLCQSAADSLLSHEEQSDEEIINNRELYLSQWLCETNVSMKQIDLSCKVAAPAVAGFLIPFLSSQNDFRLVCILIGAINVAALIVEWLCTARIYQLIPDLALKNVQPDYGRKSHGSMDDDDENDEISEMSAQVLPMEQRFWGSWITGGLRKFFEQPCAAAGLGLALLYLNSLTFGNGIMQTYLLFRGMKLESVGVLRGIASAIGLLGTFVYRFSVNRMSLESTGMWSVSYQFTCLTISLFSLSLMNDNLVLSLLVTGVCLSRIGLWVFDISVTQLQQQEIPGEIRGEVGGVQQSLNAFFNVMSYTLGIFFPDPNDFPIYVTAACVSVGLATLLFAWGIYLPRR
jgi:iron-regulated transporter 1